MKSSLDTIAFFKNIRPTLEALTDADAGRVIKMLFAHDEGEEVDLQNAPQMVRAVYPLLEESTDRLTAKRMSKVRTPQTDRKDTANDPQTDRKDAYHNHSHSHSRLSPDGDKKEEPSAPRKNEPRFAPPTLEEIRDYIHEAGLQMDPQRFFDYFTSNGWKVSGRAPMKDWKAAARNWAAREKVYRPENKKDERRIDYDAAIRDLYIREVSGG